MASQMYRVQGCTDLVNERQAQGAAASGKLVWEASEAEQADYEFRQSNERDEWGRKVRPKKETD